jgi:hypothetical protein
MATGALIATSPARTPHTPGRDVTPDTALHTRPDTDTTADTTVDTTAWPDLDPWPEPDRWPEPDSEPAGTASRTDPADRAGSGTAAAVARLRAAEPDLSAGAIAARLGVSDRTVRRHLARLPARPPLHLLAGPGPDPGAAP